MLGLFRYMTLIKARNAAGLTGLARKLKPAVCTLLISSGRASARSQYLEWLCRCVSVTRPSIQHRIAVIQVVINQRYIRCWSIGYKLRALFAVTAISTSQPQRDNRLCMPAKMLLSLSTQSTRIPAKGWVVVVFCTVVTAGRFSCPR